MRWVDVEARQPRLAAIGRQKLVDAGVVLGRHRPQGRDGPDQRGRAVPLAGRTLVADAARLVEGQGSASRPACPRPQRRHEREGTVDGEFMLRGRAVPEDDPLVNDEIAAAIAEELPVATGGR